MPDETPPKCSCNWIPTITAVAAAVAAVAGLFNARDLNSRPHAPTADAVADEVVKKTPTADVVADKVVVKTQAANAGK
jgi:hypothetical protein